MKRRASRPQRGMTLAEIANFCRDAMAQGVHPGAVPDLELNRVDVNFPWRLSGLSTPNGWDDSPEDGTPDPDDEVLTYLNVVGLDGRIKPFRISPEIPWRVDRDMNMLVIGKGTRRTLIPIERLERIYLSEITRGAQKRARETYLRTTGR